MKSTIEHVMSGYVQTGKSFDVQDRDKIYEIINNHVWLQSLSKNKIVPVKIADFKKFLQDSLDYIENTYPGL